MKTFSILEISLFAFVALNDKIDYAPMSSLAYNS